MKQGSAITAAAGVGLLDELTTIVSRAAAEVLAARRGALEVRSKADLSPVTAADLASEALILEGLSRLMPRVAVVSEEAAGQAPPKLDEASFVLVDPLDGTRELVAGRDEFTINLALVTGGRPSLGIIAAPALGLIWRTAAQGGAERLRLPPGAPASAASERVPIRPRALPERGLAALVSRSHLDPQTEAFLARLPGVQRLASGSAIKFCRVAEGAADLYPRLAPTYEWDVAAGDAILTAAGGAVTTPDGPPLAFGRGSEGFRIPGFIAWGDPSAAAGRLLLTSP